MKKIFSSFLALSIGITPLSLVVVSPSKAQVQNSPESSTQLNQLVNEAIAQTKQGQPRQAIATLQKTIELARQLKNPQIEAYALLGIGQNYGTLGEPKSALNYYNRAIVIFKATKNLDGEAVVLSNLSLVYLNTGNLSKHYLFFSSPSYYADK